MRRLLFVIFCFLAACAADGTTVVPDEMPAEPRLRYPYESSESCKGCHAVLHQQYQDSMHYRAYENPTFKALYFKKVVPRALKDPEFRDDAKKCIYCHAPVVFMNYTGLVTTTDQAEAFETGITCDFCHTLYGYKANGDYDQNPTQRKLGPRQTNVSHHAEYSGYLQVAEYCGNCHNASNHAGLEVKSTFSEWRESRYMNERISCQKCHMNKFGYLVNDKAVFDAGTVAQVNMIIGAMRTKTQEQVYTHSFPGAHSNSQIEGAITLDFRKPRSNPDDTGTLAMAIEVSNVRAGHNMPTGSSDLRFMWLEVQAVDAGGQPLPVNFVTPPATPDNPMFSVAGGSPFDGAILGSDVPQGARLYRSIFVDSQGQPTLFHFDTVKPVFDNRLKAGEQRLENLTIKLPRDYSGTIRLTATLNYRSTPSSFTRTLGVDDLPPIVIGRASRQLRIVDGRLAPAH